MAVYVKPSSADWLKGSTEVESPLCYRRYPSLSYPQSTKHCILSISGVKQPQTSLLRNLGYRGHLLEQKCTQYAKSFPLPSCKTNRLCIDSALFARFFGDRADTEDESHSRAISRRMRSDWSRIYKMHVKSCFRLSIYTPSVKVWI